MPVAGISAIDAPYRSQPIGSMVRPEELLEARRRRAAGEISPAEFKRIEDAAVDAAIRLQEEAGISIVTDGEQRRSSFEDSLLGTLAGFDSAADGLESKKRIHGFSVVDEGKETHWHSDDGGDETIVFDVLVTDRLQRAHSPVVEEFSYARARANAPVKVTLLSPTLLHWYWSPKYSRGAYPDPFDYFTDLAEILRHEVRELAALGCEYIQIDAPEFTDLVDARASRELAALGIAPERYVEQGVELINGIFDGVSGVRVGLHLCRANWSGLWLTEGGYEALTKIIFQRAQRVDEFLLEYDGSRAGGFEPLADVPDDKRVLLGIVSTKHNEVEPVDEMVARVREAAEHFPLEQLGVSTSCGFSCTTEGTPITLDIERGKLELLAKVAEEVWG